MTEMVRVDAILRHSEFRKNLNENSTAEADRCFCRHNMEHFLDVARIAWILNLEEELLLDKELVYAAALLHDIGKHKQYTEGIPHELASAELAGPILAECGFSEKETAEILQAILCHRRKEISQNKNLTGILYRADKLSRACFACKAEAECNWSTAKKNLEVRY